MYNGLIYIHDITLNKMRNKKKVEVKASITILSAEMLNK